MPDNETLYRAKYTKIQQVPPPDELISGWYTSAEVHLTAPGILRRGTLLMSSGNNEFIPATSGGISSAYETAVLCNDIDTEGETVIAGAYFSGEVNSTALIIPWETDADSHEDIIDSIRPVLRRSGLHLL